MNKKTMPRVVDYPRVTLKNAYELASSIDLLGGRCSVQSAADGMKLKVSGSFNALVSATSKYGLIDIKSGQLSTTPLYRNIKLAYDDNEKIEFERQAFFSMVLFNKLYETFKGKPLPVTMLSKFLVRELNVEENIATRVKNIFIEGLKQIKLLDSDNNVIEIKPAEEEEQSNIEVMAVNNSAEEYSQNKISNSKIIEIQDSNEFSFHIVGPGINTKITIVEEEDFDILNAVIRKIKKKFNFTEGA
ncbi:hypothetical protein GWR56_04415 [Mucilaginibacter sp. 14171R-50]|uniref:hypothetical protein n=1 Tax=Mucilaginibacter sp. 14171R-50 TaxID=2703789 RepID=UPI00138C7305|nr:hypothetical protein [Mucilaginibacter sp. 14171R-50]QHS54825.1 hypothetical protein GWR56_04415 [Mucilaginibacter sp. 14171R-50]